MSLYEQWIRQAYTPNGQTIPKTWKNYLPREQKIYEYILENKVTTMDFTVSGLGEQYDMSPQYICGFADGIKEALDNEVKPEELEEDTKVVLEINHEALFKKMVEYKAEHLYSLPQWGGIFDDETRERMKREVSAARTFVRESGKIGRNEPCSCGSGKKYKKCCGA